MKQRTPAETAALNATILAGLHAYKDVGVIAKEVGIPTTYCYSIIRRIGMSSIFVSDAEKSLIATARRSTKWRKFAD